MMRSRQFKALKRRVTRSLRKSFRSLSRAVRKVRRFIRKRPVPAALIIAGLLLWGGMAAHEQSEPKVNPAAYSQLLLTIAKGESNGNYNAHYGNAGNTTVRFTSMSVAEVLHWQEEYVRQGSPSSAVGKYQIIRPTLAGLVRQLDIDSGVLFDEALQDRLAIALLERRGSVAYVEKQLSRDEFAANLAKEWAALPRVVGGNPGDSYYAGDGLNESRISVDEIFAALSVLENNAAL